MLTFSSAQRPPRGTVCVVNAKEPISGGSRVQAKQVGTICVPESMVPEGKFGRVDEVIGQSVSIDVPTGAILTSSHLLTRSHAKPGTALVGVQLSDSSLLSMLRVGQRVSVVASGDDGPGIIAKDAVIRGLPHEGGGGLMSNDQSELIVVSTDEQSAARVATQNSQGQIGIVVR
ncbi:SAF domain-containing protein [Cutibacterium granulosum]|uniref:SAF domain-containing protein n=1 Tax=Cutibacterium granulosum TaxID=33011 RepID=UPI0027BB0915|nr:SAF domain-containing protein [Cutibacterium granulosum]MDU1582008.1 SAF domain-containing protein [Cutibacterium granulosum]MEA5632775.1 SAF domain-containing protein [Cutibacterium granulosum]MEA5642031.1 SAF domain-containing protein [Cutibacterium granulosum]